MSHKVLTMPMLIKEDLSICICMQELYKEGARNFLVVGIAADGCISMMLTRVPHKTEDLDSLGCLTTVNNYVQYHNELLFEAVKNLRVELPDTHISYGDFFSANVDILVNASAYGEYNYNPIVQCGQTGEVEGNNVTAYSCEEPSKYINWDGIHLTEHFYEVIAFNFLHGRFVDQPLILPSSCVLNVSSFNTYSNFGKRLTRFKPS
ncbi:hypothetical protein L7F22_018418 [Adiantum nelumboides]|nr:hypothetical protein [Adiantum nelumboides]